MKQETQNTKNSTKNSISKMGDLQKVSNAKNMVELKEAVNNILVLLQNLVDESYLTRFKSATNDLLNNPQNQQSKDAFYEETESALKRHGVKNGRVLKSTVHSFDKDYVDEVKKSMVGEYRATSLSEFMIIDIAINAYFRSLRSADVYSILIQNKEGVINYGDQQKINMIK